MHELSFCKKTHCSHPEEAINHAASNLNSDNDPDLHSRSVRSLFVSDLHLGFRYSRAREFLEFLNRYRPENLYIVGDFIDGWYLSKNWHWCTACDEIILKLVHLAESGTRIFLTIGNHDRFLSSPMLKSLVRFSRTVELSDQFLHVSASGKDFIVIHGDQFDEMEHASPALASILCWLYEWMLFANQFWARVACSHSSGQQSLACRIRMRLRICLQHLRTYQHKAIHFARRQGCHGIICGHIHSPKFLEIEGVTYINTGDWLENCSACVEDHDGRFSIVSYDRP